MILAVGFLGLDAQAWVGVAIGSVFSLVLSILFYQLQKKPRTLDYAISSTQDFTVEAGMPTGLVVSWMEEAQPNEIVMHPLVRPRIVNCRIRNTGKRAIDADDFKEPIQIEVATGSIVDAVVTRVSHPGVFQLGSIPGERESSTRVFTPVLMNPGDWINIQVITNECPDYPKLTSWIREESRSMQNRPEILDPPVLEVVKRSLLHSEFLVWLLTMITAIAAVAGYILAGMT
jgi:hypothetical protein